MAVANAPQQQGGGPALPPDAASEGKEGLRVAVKARSAACASGAPCTWEVTATNIGATPITGAMATGMFMVASSAGRALPNILTESVSSSGPPGTTCGVEPGFGQDKIPACKNPQFSLAPGATVTMTYSVKINVPAGTPIDFFQALGLVGIGGVSEFAIGSVQREGVNAGGVAPGRSRRAPKQIAPGKKSEAPLGKNPLLKLASFRPPVFPQQESHSQGRRRGRQHRRRRRTASVAVPEVPEGRLLRPAEQRLSGLVHGLTQINSKLFGTATFISANGPVQGRVTGTVGASDFRIVVDWSNGSQGTYTGTIAPGGNVTGRTVDKAGGSATFTSVAPLVCVEDEACFKYAKDAGLRAKSSHPKSAACHLRAAGRWSTSTTSTFA